ncbi:MAG: cytochrome c family protein [Coriobacteriia bacterium]|nr:cytochrome c family protein [Coriobacteriia bacterium]
MGNGIGFRRLRPFGVAAATIALAAAFFVAASPALALDTAVWSEASPAAGAVVLVKPTAPRVVADDTANITKATVTMNGTPASFVYVDFYVGHFYYDDEAESDIWVIDDYTKARITGYFASRVVVNGINTIVTTVTSSRGVSTYTRTFTHGAVTAIGAVSPSADTVVPISPADITVVLSSGATSFASAMMLDGVVVPTNYTSATKTFTHMPAAQLSAGWHTADFTALDSSGGSVSRSWRFKVSPPMSDGGDCQACHSGYPAAHPVPDCSVCHTRGYTVQGGTHGREIPTAAGCMGDGGSEQDDACHRLDHSSDVNWGIWGAGPFACADCHSSAYPNVANHVEVSSNDSHLLTTTGCALCHEASLIDEHGKYPAQAVIKYQCTECHTSSARQVVKDAVAARSTACDSCHAGGGTHPGANHSGSDAFTRDYTANFPVRWGGKTANYAFGCAPTPAAGQTVCHDVSNLASLHSRLPDNGCTVCHGDSGATPAGANECLTCHGTGWYNPSISKGTVARPGRDYSTSGTVTRVGGSGSDNFSTVATNDNATSYLRFASTNAEAMFGTGFWWLNPNTASVTSVQVLFRAMKLATGTTNSRMTVVLNVGGNTYVSPAAVSNPGTAAYAQYTYTFATNPKTGLAWTPADLNDPGSANGLRAFGVRQTAADSANIGVTEVLLKVNTPDTNYTTAPKAGGNAHHYGDYLRSP